MFGTILCRAAKTRAIAARPLPWLLFGASFVCGGLTGCGALDVSDPTAVEESELNDAAGAQLLRGSALKKLYEVAARAAYVSGLLADEFLVDPPVWATPGTWPEDVLNQRESAQFEGLGDDAGYVQWQETRRAAAVAIPKLQVYTQNSPRVGEIFAVRGFASLRLAEDFCSGLPLHDVVDFKAVLSGPLSTEEALAKALADLDSAVAYAADSARILNLARVWRGRTLLGLGRFADAAAAVADVPTDYVANAEYSTSAGPTHSDLVFGRFGNLEKSVADQEGGVGLDFVSAQDPRVETDSIGMARDGVTEIHRIVKYPDRDAPFQLASGIEARLIEAEAALNADPESGAWLTILNTLRSEAVGGVAGLAPLSDPGTDVARQDLLFRERAFWFFATGHRLADLRRLVRVYGRSPEQVFPTGPYRLGGMYGTATSIPYLADRETPFNPAVTGCTAR